MTFAREPREIPLHAAAPPRLPRNQIPQTSLASWLVTGAATALAAAIRLSDLDRARSLVFDETYYVKDAWSLWTLGYEGQWAENRDAAFAAGDTSGLSPIGAFIVHPPLGKWLIGAGQQLLGQADPVGWRLAAALIGILGVLLTCRLAWHLFGSVQVTLLAGLFLATDGMHVVMSRIGLLDVFVGTFVLGAFLAVVIDQSRLAVVLTSQPPGTRASLWRPWLLMAGVLLGFACATKWSGVYAVAVLGLLVVIHEATMRLRGGEGFAASLRRAAFPDGLAAFGYLVLVPAAVYVASWTGWLLNPQAWGHRVGGGGFLDRLSDLLAYHRQMWSFHTGLTTTHPYQSSPLGWMLQLRPTSFWFDRPMTGCGGSDCASAISALGNPLLWWVGSLALIALALYTAARRSWGGVVVLSGLLAMYAPWLLYLHRTVFTFYTVAFAPFVALAAAWALGTMWRTSRTLRIVAIAVGCAILASAVYFAPIWTGWPIPYQEWAARMWLRSWI